MDYETIKEELRLLILRKGIKWNTGKVHGGRRAKWIFDIREPLCTPKGSHLAAQVLFEKLKDADFDGIGGPSIAAEPLTSAFLLYSLDKGRSVKGFIIRKKPNDFGLRKKVEGPIKRRDRVVLIDDILNSGASMKDARAALEAEGCEVVKIVTLVDFCHSGIRQYDNVDHVFTLQDFNLEKNALFCYETFKGIPIEENKAIMAIKNNPNFSQVYQFNDKIVATYTDGKLACFDLQGNKRWEETFSNPISRVHATQKQIIVVVPSEFKRSKLYLFNIEGSLVGEQTFRGIIADMIVDGSGFLIAVGKKIVRLANDLQTFSQTDFSETLEKIFMHANTIYVADSDGNLTCLDSENNNKWSLHFGKVQQIFFNDFLYVVAADFLFCVDAQQGEMQWWQPIKNQVSALHIFDGTIFIGCTQGYLYEFSKNGVLQHCYKTGMETLTRISDDGKNTIVTLANEKQYRI